MSEQDGPTKFIDQMKVGETTRLFVHEFIGNRVFMCERLFRLASIQDNSSGTMYNFERVNE